MQYQSSATYGTMGQIRRSVLMILSAVCVCFVVVTCTNQADQLRLGAFRTRMDSIENALEYDNFGRALQLFEEIAQVSASRVPLSDEVRYWKALYHTAFETGDYELAIQAGVATTSLEWDDQLHTMVQPYIPIAHALKKAGDTAKAIEWYLLADNNVAETARRDILSNLASLYEATGQYRLALSHIDEAALLYRYHGTLDPVGVAWWNLLRAQCYGGLDNFTMAETYLDSALMILENQNRDGESFSQKDVRLSLYRGFWRDSVMFRQMGRAWHYLNHRLQKLYRRDSAELEAMGLPDVRRKQRRSLRHSIPQHLSGSYRNLPEPLHPALITSRLIDHRGWKWIGTLRGLCLEIGTVIIPVETFPHVDSRRPVRDLSANANAILIHRYDGSTDSIAWTTLVDDRHIRHSHMLASVDVEWHPWRGAIPTGLISLQDTTTVLHFYASRFGVAGLREEPATTYLLETVNGDRWDGVVRCGLSITPDTVLLGTNRGVWLLTLRDRSVRKIRLAPEHLNQADVSSMGTLIDGSLRITIPFADPVVFDTIARHEGQVMMGEIEDVAFEFERTLTSATPVVTFLHGINTAAIGNRRNHPAPHYSAPSPSIRIWIWDRTIYLYDATRSSLTFHSIPDSISVDGRYPVASFGTANDIFGMMMKDGLMIGRVTRSTLGPGQRIVAYRTQGMTHYRVSAEGAQIELSGAERDLELYTGRPANWDGVTIRQSWLVPWSGQYVSSRTNQHEVISNVPVGDHDLYIRSGDRYEPLRVSLAVAPTIPETLWFKSIGVMLILGLVTGSIRYVLLLRRNKRDLQLREQKDERIRIGQDVHDAIGADLVRISIAARSPASPTNNHEIARIAREASRTLRDIIWSVSDVHTFDAVIAVTIERIRAMAEETGLAFSLDAPELLPGMELTPQQSRDVVLIVSEAMTNVIKHAHATSVTYTVSLSEREATLTLEDNGIGYDPITVVSGVGMNSIRSRARRSGLIVDLTSNALSGSTISLKIPLKGS